MLIVVFLICLAATILGAITGVGGGVIIKPVLDSVLAIPASVVSFMSGCTVLAMSAVSVFKSRKHLSLLDMRQSTLLALSGAMGGIVGKQLMQLVKNAAGELIVGLAQNGVLLLLTAGVFIFTLNKRRITMKRLNGIWAYLLVGLCLGMLASFLGIGGGPFNLAVLAYFFAFDTKTSAMLSLYVILFSQAASLLMSFLTGTIPASLDLAMLSLMISGGVGGALIGGMISKRLNNGGVDKVFMVMLALIMFICLGNVGAAIIY